MRTFLNYMYRVIVILHKQNHCFEENMFYFFVHNLYEIIFITKSNSLTKLEKRIVKN